MKDILSLLMILGLQFNQVVPNGFSGYGPCPRPPNFPNNIGFILRSFETFDRATKVPFAYTVLPRNAEEVVTLSNWAYQNGFRVRAMGQSHSWAPFQFALSDSGVSCPKTILVDTRRQFTSMVLNPTDFGRPDLHSVTAGSGVTLLNFLAFLEKQGLGLFASPTIGPVTIGGMLAVGAHGTGVPSKFDQKSPGHTYGTMSNLVMDMTIVAWNKNSSSYHLKTLYRWDKDCKAFLTNLGRTFVISATLRVGKNQNLRTQNHFFIPATELFTHPKDVTDSTRTIAKFADSYGRINPISLTLARLMFVMTWKSEPLKPPKSRAVHGPFNYYYLNYVPRFIDPLARILLNRIPAFARVVALLGYPFMFLGMVLSRSVDYWGPSKNHLLYLPSDAVRGTANAFTIVTSRTNLQLVLWTFKFHYDILSEEYAKQNRYPNPSEFNVRLTGLDNPADVEIPGAESPSLSPASILAEYPDYDVVIWIESSGFPDTPSMNEFNDRLQSLVLKDIHRKIGVMRTEWPKAWGFTSSGPWKNATVMNSVYPRSFSSSDRMEEWNWAVKTLNSYDPHQIFSNNFLDNLLMVY